MMENDAERSQASASSLTNWASLAARTASKIRIDADLLGDFLPDVAAAFAGTPPGRPQIDGYRALGRRAAHSGVALRMLVDLYLTAVRTAWPQLSSTLVQSSDTRLDVATAYVLAAIDDVVAAVCEGFEDARSSLSRAEEALRREFVDDLLTGTSRIDLLVERASAFGLRLEATHVTLVVSASRAFLDHRVVVRDVEAALISRSRGLSGTLDVLVATRHGLLVAVVSAAFPGAVDVVTTCLDRESSLSWRLSVSRPHGGIVGIRASFEEARNALSLADRLSWPARIVPAENLLIYKVLTRDREAITELVAAVLAPLSSARGGAGPLLETLREYFATGGVAVAAAKRLHLSVRAVTYRLDRVTALTGRDVRDPDDRFVLEAALRGAQVLDWPREPLFPAS